MKKLYDLNRGQKGDSVSSPEGTIIFLEKNKNLENNCADKTGR